MISANVSERDLRGVVNDIRNKVDESIKLPEGYHIEYGGQFESEEAASRTLLLTSLMSLLVIFMLLYNEFKNEGERRDLVEPAVGVDRWRDYPMAYFQRDQYPGDYRFHFLVWYRYPKRYAADQPLYAFAWRGNGIA